jgi:hypothetical protein
MKVFNTLIQIKSAPNLSLVVSITMFGSLARFSSTSAVASAKGVSDKAPKCIRLFVNTNDEGCRLDRFVERHLHEEKKSEVTC